MLMKPFFIHQRKWKVFNMLRKLASLFTLSLDHTSKYRIGFLAILTITPLLISFADPSGPELYPLYLLAPIFLGLGFADKSPSFFIACTSLLVFVRCSFTHSQGVPHPLTLLLLGFIYLTVAFIAAGLTRNYVQTKRKTLEMITALAKTIDSRDAVTASHSDHVARYALMIAEEMRMPPNVRRSIYIGGLLHDIGKIGVAENVLFKNGKLTTDEFAHIKEHTVVGYHTLQHIDEFRNNGVLDMVRSHHERYDGNGYPDGLKGEDIPLPARIMAVADTFDAMTSNRVYRNALDLQEVTAEIRKQKNAQFDPVVADAFLAIADRLGSEIFAYMRSRKPPL